VARLSALWNSLIKWLREWWPLNLILVFVAAGVGVVLVQIWPHSDPWANHDGSMAFGTAPCQPYEHSPCITGESSSFRRGSLKEYIAHLNVPYNVGLGFTQVVVRHIGGSRRAVSTQPLSLLTPREAQQAREGIYITIAPTILQGYDSRSLAPGTYTMSILLRRAVVARGDFTITA
jgi:hypothetical protein